MLHHHAFQPLSLPTAVAIGNFDGLHLGHRRIIDRARAMAGGGDLALAIVTFEPHPRLAIGQDVALISTPAQKRALLEAESPDALFTVPFAAVSGMTAEEFVSEALVGALHMRALALGHDFRFGRGRLGDENTLAGLAARSGFVMAVEPPFAVDGRVVSSSAIRKLLAGGDMVAAARMLGRPYALDGTVVTGEGRGRSLGFPTLNLRTGNRILPGGVFRSRTTVCGRRFDSVTHIGPLPTFASGTMRVETHVLDFDQEVYGEPARVELMERLRGIRRFASAAELAEQIRRDVEVAFPGRSD